MGRLVGPLQLAEAELLLQLMAQRQQSRAGEDATAALLARLEGMAERLAHVNGPQAPASQCSPAELIVRGALSAGDVGSLSFRQVVRIGLREYVAGIRTELAR